MYIKCLSTANKKTRKCSSCRWIKHRYTLFKRLLNSLTCLYFLSLQKLVFVMKHVWKMRKEIAAVVFFLKSLVKKGEKLESHKIELFVERLAIALQEKFKGHWYPETPSKGQAYRCLSFVMLQNCSKWGSSLRDVNKQTWFYFQVHSSEQVPEAGSRPPSSEPGKRGEVWWPGTASWTHAVGGPWRGLLQVRRLFPLGVEGGVCPCVYAGL